MLNYNKLSLDIRIMKGLKQSLAFSFFNNEYILLESEKSDNYNSYATTYWSVKLNIKLINNKIYYILHLMYSSITFMAILLLRFTLTLNY